MYADHTRNTDSLLPEVPAFGPLTHDFRGKLGPEAGASAPNFLRPGSSVGRQAVPEHERVALRASAVNAVRRGEKKRHVAQRYGISRQTLHNWITRYRSGGTLALAARPNGRPRRAVLEPAQEDAVTAAITHLPPTTVDRRYTRWTKSAIAAFVEQRFGVRLSPWQVDSHLRRWGFASHKAVRRAFIVNQARADSPRPPAEVPAAAGARF